MVVPQVISMTLKVILPKADMAGCGRLVATTGRISRRGIAQSMRIDNFFATERQTAKEQVVRMRGVSRQLDTRT